MKLHNKILDGKHISQLIQTEIKKHVTGLSRPPKLSVILVGNNYASSTYVRKKGEACRDVKCNIYFWTDPKYEVEASTDCFSYGGAIATSLLGVAAIITTWNAVACSLSVGGVACLGVCLGIPVLAEVCYPTCGPGTATTTALCIAVASAATAALLYTFFEYGITWPDCSENHTFRLGFKQEGFNDKPINPSFYISQNEDEANYYWSPGDGSMSGITEIPVTEYKNNYISIAYDVQEDSGFIPPSSFTDTTNNTVDSAVYPYMKDFTPEQVVAYKPGPGGFFIAMDNHLMPDEVVVTTPAETGNTDSSTENMNFAYLYTPAYAVGLNYSFSDDSFMFGLRNTAMSNVYKPALALGDSWWEFPTNDLDKYIDEPETAKAGFRANQYLIGVDKAYAKHITVKREEAINLLSSTLYTLPEGFTSEECHVHATVNTIKQKDAYDPDEGSFGYGHKISVIKKDEDPSLPDNQVKIISCLQRCAEGSCDYTFDCVDPTMEPSFYESNSVSALVVCNKFKN